MNTKKRNKNKSRRQNKTNKIVNHRKRNAANVVQSDDNVRIVLIDEKSDGLSALLGSLEESHKYDDLVLLVD
ncbi:hypothetical protein [Winogradskyella sediminis]|uniref:hypothetical protein n=1 Tax=Winogradskyella sediminis TaxID=1382466 RepID=UPI003AA83BE2